LRTAEIHLERRRGLRASKRLLKLAGDERLVDELRRGNEAALEVAYERHGGGVLSFCRHMLGSREEAEEAVQHTFANAWSDLQRNERPVKLKPWLYTIARNRCISLLRARKPDAVELDEASVTAGLADEVSRRADLRALLADLGELPEEQRAALVLSELGGLSHADVAQVLGRKEADVKGIVFRARSTLVDWRDAREIPCEEIREQLSVLTGGSLRRRSLRRHLQTCEGCREFREKVKTQRRMMALILPVLPSVGLKRGILAAAGIGGGSAGGGAAAGVGAGGIAGATLGPVGAATVAKVAVVAVVAGGAVTAGQQAIDSDDPVGPAPATAEPGSGSSATGAGDDASNPGVAPGSPAAGARGGEGAGAPGAKGRSRRGENGRGASDLAPPDTPVRAKGNPPALGRAKKGLAPPPSSGTRDGGRALGKQRAPRTKIKVVKVKPTPPPKPLKPEPTEETVPLTTEPLP
jgi:RNA polymerase sigma factor (sigma-70 family)